MRKSWYRRMLLSYFPVFFFTVTILIFLSLVIVNEISSRETEKADRITTDYVIETMELALNNIDMNILKEVEKNEHYSYFFQNEHSINERTVIFDLVDSMRTLVSNDHWIDSIYIYRNKDQVILTKNGLVEEEDFLDRTFIEQMKSNPAYQGWSLVRSYKELANEQDRRVISMYKRGPLPFGSDGFLVINVDMYAIERLILSMNNEYLSFMDVYDSAGELLISTRTAAYNVKEQAAGRVLNKTSSNMLNWTFESGIADGKPIAWISIISYIWIIIGALTIIFAIIYIIYITRRNYQPIRVMMDRIESLRLRMDGGQSVQKDELTLIDHALESLIERTSEYEKRQRESMLLGRRQLFIDIIHGERLGTLKERLLELKPLPEETRFNRYAVVVVEIGHYSEFQQSYSVKDQSTLKFALTNVLPELASGEGLHGWAEWIGASRMGILFGIEGDSAAEQIIKFAESGHEWTSRHLKIQLTFGVGIDVGGWEQIEHSYKAALETLQHKLTMGQHDVIMSRDLPEDSKRKLFKHVQSIADFVKEFRMSSGEWRVQLESIFDNLESDGLKDEDIRMLLHTLMDMLGRELGNLSESLEEFFKADKADAWRQLVMETTSLAQLRSLFQENLTEIFRTYVVVIESNSHHAMINEMKSYIEENFVDPDLSLKHLSDRFNISGKYASYLFKKEFDMKFVDFLVQLRMERAGTLLTETEETIQAIALQVGYANSITFGRMFKREFGITPGEYRKRRLKS